MPPKISLALARISQAGSPSIIVAGESGNPGLENLANELTEGGTGEEDGDASPGAFEQQLIGNPGGGGPPNPLPLITSLKREYIWGPGDNGLDELLVQYDPYRQAQWALMDSGGDLVALCDTSGTSGTQTGLSRVVAQWTFDPYGNVTSAENIALPINAEPHLGHKGMFLERLDAGVVDSLSGIETPRLVPGSYLITHNRNRNGLLPFGRWMQSDPNATGHALACGSNTHGLDNGLKLTWQVVDEFSLQTTFHDGSNLYQYCDSNTYSASDPYGLFALMGDTLGASMVRNMIFGAGVGGLAGGLGSKAGGGTFWDGAWKGALGGLAGGAVTAGIGSFGFGGFHLGSV